MFFEILVLGPKGAFVRPGAEKLARRSTIRTLLHKVYVSLNAFVYVLLQVRACNVHVCFFFDAVMM